MSTKWAQEVQQILTQCENEDHTKISKNFSQIFDIIKNSDDWSEYESFENAIIHYRHTFDESYELANAFLISANQSTLIDYLLSRFAYSYDDPITAVIIGHLIDVYFHIENMSNHQRMDVFLILGMPKETSDTLDFDQLIQYYENELKNGFFNPILWEMYHLASHKGLISSIVDEFSRKYSEFMHLTSNGLNNWPFDYSNKDSDNLRIQYIINAIDNLRLTLLNGDTTDDQLVDALLNVVVPTFEWKWGV